MATNIDPVRHVSAGDIARAIAPRAIGRKAEAQRRILAAVGPALDAEMARHEITLPLRIAHFLGQLAHESDGFATCEEYASGAAYEGRRDLGNVAPGDGRRFKGRGLIQLTGRANYRTYGALAGVDLVARPALAADPPLAARIACLYWARRGLNRLADADDLVAITRAINGGTNGLESRRRYVARAKAMLGL